MKIVICDDDAKHVAICRKQLEQLSSKYDIDISIAAVESGNRLMFEEELLGDADLIYLDEHMPGMSGMETAFELRKRNIQADIVFFTVDDTRVLDAFDVEALHYIVKNKTTESKFEEIFLKARVRAYRRHSEILSISCAGEYRNIDLRDIQYFEVENRIVTAVYQEDNRSKRFEFYSTLSKIEEQLFGKGFIRIHRSYLVKKVLIKGATKTEVELITGEVFPVGRKYSPLPL